MRFYEPLLSMAAFLYAVEKSSIGPQCNTLRSNLTWFHFVSVIYIYGENGWILLTYKMMQYSQQSRMRRSCQPPLLHASHRPQGRAIKQFSCINWIYSFSRTISVDRIDWSCVCSDVVLVQVQCFALSEAYGRSNKRILRRSLLFRSWRRQPSQQLCYVDYMFYSRGWHLLRSRPWCLLCAMVDLTGPRARANLRVFSHLKFSVSICIMLVCIRAAYVWCLHVRLIMYALCTLCNAFNLCAYIYKWRLHVWMHATKWSSSCIWLDI